MTPEQDFERLIADDTDIDRYAVFARLRAEAPVMWSETLSAWVVTRWHDVTLCLEDERFVPMTSGAGSSAIYGRTVLQMSGDEHRRKAAIVARRIRNPRMLAGDLHDFVAALVIDRMDRLPAAPSVADFRDIVTSQVPLTVIAELMAMRDAVGFADWYHRIVAASVSNVREDPQIHASGVEAREELFAWLTPVIDQKRREPSDDLLSDLCNASYEGERLSDDEIRSFCAFLLSAGIETTDRAISNLFHELARHPDQWSALDANRDLVPSAAAEILRFRAPVQGAVRRADRDVRLGGQDVSAGDKMILMLGSANHDESVFPAPEVFDVTRFDGRVQPQFTPIGPLRAFGAGEHTCTGSLLARLEIEQVLGVALDRFRSIEPAGDQSRYQGFMLRSPENVRLLLHPR